MDTAGKENSLDVGIFIKTPEGFNEIKYVKLRYELI